MIIKNKPQWIYRNNSWDKGYDVAQDEKIVLDISMPKGIFRVGFIWWEFQSFVSDYFPENYSYARISDGGYDKLEVIGTPSEIKLIYDLFIERTRNFQNPSMHVKKLRRYLDLYFKKVETGKNVRCLESYLKDNHPGWS